MSGLPAAVQRPILSHEEARSLTDEVKHDAEQLWRKLLELYEGGAHLALGYPSWAAYYEAEFGGGKSQAYRILDAGRVVAALDSPNGGTVPNERQARELAPLLRDDPEELRDAWQEVVVDHPVPTAKDIKKVVNRHRTSSDSSIGEPEGKCLKERLLEALNRTKVEVLMLPSRPIDGHTDDALEEIAERLIDLSFALEEFGIEIENVLVERHPERAATEPEPALFEETPVPNKPEWA